ncbi:hypothetical protein LTSEMIS_2851, partial [Salmonella enterica subsp. enterica serovar Mississippi str. A4-633]
MSRLTFALLLTDEFTGVQQCRPRRAMNRRRRPLMMR